MTEETKPLTVYQKLAKVQAELKAPKTNNPNVAYKSRSCEDILEQAKPILHKYGLIVTMTDEIFMVGARYYVKATANLIDLEGDGVITVTANAGEGQKGKMVDESQATGKASSYARKYALGGMFAIDDTKDSDKDSQSERTQQNDSITEAEKIKNEARQLYSDVQKAGATQDQLDNLVSLMKSSNIAEFTIQAYLAYVDALGATQEQITHLAGLQKDIKNFTETAGYMLTELKEKKE